MAYARLVAGTSTVSKNHQIWVLRNENSTHMTQHQLQYLQDAALTDLVRKRFMAANGSTVADMGQSVAEVVQSLNLEWEQFQLWGLHHVVEACECEVVMLLMQSGFLIKDPNIRSVAIRLRRCEDMCVPFALCVGAFICANQGLMTGATVTKVNGLRQEDHKLSLLRFMQDAITHNQESLYDCLLRQDPTDYVHRLSYINIVSPSKNIPDVVMQDEQSGTGGVSVQVGGGSQITEEVRKFVEKLIKAQMSTKEQELKKTSEECLQKLTDLSEIIHQNQTNSVASNTDLKNEIDNTIKDLKTLREETTRIQAHQHNPVNEDKEMEEKTDEWKEQKNTIIEMQIQHNENIADIQEKIQNIKLMISIANSKIEAEVLTNKLTKELHDYRFRELQDQIKSLNQSPNMTQPTSPTQQSNLQPTPNNTPLPSQPQSNIPTNPQNIQKKTPHESQSTPIKVDDKGIEDLLAV